MNPTPDDIRTVLEFAQAVARPKLADLTPEQKPYFSEPDAVMYVIFHRIKGCVEWYPAESYEDETEALTRTHGLTERNERDWASGAGREYICVKRTSTFEILSGEIPGKAQP